MMIWLSQNGASAEQKDSNGYRPLDLACINGDLVAVVCLLEDGIAVSGLVALSLAMI